MKRSRESRRSRQQRKLPSAQQCIYIPTNGAEPVHGLTLRSPEEVAKKLGVELGDLEAMPYRFNADMSYASVAFSIKSLQREEIAPFNKAAMHGVEIATGMKIIIRGPVVIFTGGLPWERPEDALASVEA